MATRRLYYDDSFIKEFDARVLSCEPSSEVRSGGLAQPLWEVELDQTALYPTSGGQPYDTGKLSEAAVLDVYDEGDAVLHLVDRELERGAVNGCVNWPRRFDHMQQHTGQHLLSAMFLDRFALHTVSFHLGAELCTIDLRGPAPSEAMLEGVERAANEIIFENRPISVRYGTAEEFAELGVRKEVKRSGILRAIEIEGADLQPCGGTHVNSTGQIGVLLVRDISKVRDDWRVQFLCGRRAERAARADFSLLRDACAAIKCSPAELVGSVTRTLGERDAYFKTTKLLTQQLARSEAAATIARASISSNGLRVVAKVFGSEQQDFSSAFSAEIAKSEKAVALVAEEENGQLIFAQHPASATDMSELLKKVFAKYEGKGGGTKDLARGRLKDATHAKPAVALAAALIA